MKKILTMLFLGLFYGTNAQTITYDYNSRVVTNPDITNRMIISYKINNINTFANKVVINGTVFNLNTDMPADIAKLFGIKTEAVNNSADETAKKVDEMKSVAAEATDNAENEAATSPKTKAKSETNALVQKCDLYYKEVLKVKDIILFHKKMLESLNDRQINTMASMIANLNSKGINQPSINALRLGLNAFKIAYKDVYEQYIKAAQASRKAANEVHETKIENAENTVEKEYYKLLEQYETTLCEIENLYLKANDANMYMAISEPLQVIDVEEVEFKTKIGAKTDDFEKIEPMTQSFNISGGIRMDYSVGPVFKTISDDSYYLDADKKLAKNENNNAFTPGIATMVHLLRRSADYTTWGGVFGINADFKEITDVNLGFLGGVSFVFGRKQKAIVSTGISFSKVSRLKDGQFKVGTKYVDADLANATEKVFKPSFFLSFSLSIAKRTQAK